MESTSITENEKNERDAKKELPLFINFFKSKPTLEISIIHKQLIPV